MEKHKYYTDQERYEHCRKCRISGKTISEFLLRVLGEGLGILFLHL